MNDSTMKRDTLVKDAIIAGFRRNRRYRAGIEASLPLRCADVTKASRAEKGELTGVGHELKRAAEFPIAGRRASAHVEHVGSERGETLDVGVP